MRKCRLINNLLGSSYFWIFVQRYNFQSWFSDYWTAIRSHPSIFPHSILSEPASYHKHPIGPHSRDVTIINHSPKWTNVHTHKHEHYDMACIAPSVFISAFWRCTFIVCSECVRLWRLYPALNFGKLLSRNCVNIGMIMYTTLCTVQGDTSVDCFWIIDCLHFNQSMFVVICCEDDHFCGYFVLH